mgnify:CR=1 FL=1
MPLPILTAKVTIPESINEEGPIWLRPSGWRNRHTASGLPVPAVALVLAHAAAIVLALFYNGQDAVFYGSAFITMIIGVGLAVWTRGIPVTLIIGPAGFLLVLLFLWTATATFWSFVPYLSQIATAMIGMAVLSYMLWRLLLGLPGTARPSLAALLLLGLAVAITLLMQAGIGQRPVGTFLNPNNAAGFANLFWPMTAALALVATNRSHRLLLLSATALIVLSASIDGSRAAALALLASLIVLALAAWRAGCPRQRMLAMLATVLVTLIIANSANEFGVGGRGQGYFDRVASVADVDSAGASRFRIWSATGDMIRERPWLGFGPGTFFQAYPPYRSGKDSSAAYHVHNDYLQFWVEGGLPAILLVLGVCGVSAWLFIRGLRVASRHPTGFMISAGAAASLAGLSVHAVFSYNLQMPPFLMVAGALIAILEGHSLRSFGLCVPLKAVRQRPLAIIAFAGLLLIPVVQVAAMTASHTLTERAMFHIERDDADAADRSFWRARQLWDTQDLAWSFNAGMYARLLSALDADRSEDRQRLLNRGLEMVSAAIERNSLRAHPWIIRAELLLEAPEPDRKRIESALREALAREPRAVRARLHLVALLRRHGEPDKAAEVLRQGAGMVYSRRNPRPLWLLGSDLHRAMGNIERAENLRERYQASLQSGSTETRPDDTGVDLARPAPERLPGDEAVRMVPIPDSTP